MVFFLYSGICPDSPRSWPVVPLVLNYPVSTYNPVTWTQDRPSFCLLRQSLSLMAAIAHVTHNLPLFLEGVMPVHTHSSCDKCYVFQRGSCASGAKLLRCGGCSIAFYCSKECQTADWGRHKVECKATKYRIAEVKTASGIESGYADFMEWIRFYSDSLKNAFVGALGLQTAPHREREYVLDVWLCHKGVAVTQGPGRLPVSKRFDVLGVSLKEPRELTILREDSNDFTESYPDACVQGRIELGDEYYGTGRISYMARFVPGLSFSAGHVATKQKVFAFSKEVAGAARTRDDWWILFREYVAVGAKMKFCCGRIPGFEDVCCCGGWVHDEEKKNAFISHRV
ncbi:hypothetical protein MIND_01408500 [Mycena indigotica]|uniref:MYND-type domain-containing protein n=1 Tax=Mycena indigotica TaxID=2126181 RepID=A0A8H6RYC5_9AGAR|nr:uncharacterized protein MIND_01408500 [Mycena indigotica]KAF7288923.1 hypothetical protein MIND_01408500 [Mycena indigotica]